MNSLKNILNKKIKKGDIPNAIDKTIYTQFFQKKIYLWIAIVALSAGFILQAIPYKDSWDIDSPTFYTAAKGILLNINIYDEQQFQELAVSTFGKSLTVFPYLYWPLLAQMFIPLSLLSPSDYFTFLFFLNITLTFLCLYLIYCLLELKDRKTNLPVMFLFSTIIYNVPLFINIRNGQINLLVFTSILLSLLLLKNNNQYISSFLLCLAIFIKIHPVLFLAVFLFQKKYRYLIYSFINFVIIFLFSSLLFPFNHWSDFIRMAISNFLHGKQTEFFFDFSIHPQNNSLNSFISQIFLRYNIPRSYVMPAIALIAVILIIIFKSKIKNFLQTKNLNFEISAILMLILIFSVISWHHHYITMIFPLAYFFNQIIKDRRYHFLLPFLLLAFCILCYPKIGGGLPFNQTRLISTIFFLILFFYYHFSGKTADSHHV
jgi:hypothetical protein